MEDRYLFRAKRKNNGEWIFGNLIQTDDRVYIIQNYVRQHLIKNYEVDQFTVCQYTGLKDKNGRLIFENDILSGHIDVEFPEDETRKRVVWHENGWCTNEPGCDDYEALDDFDSENFEVIGNMIDNPELLEV
ncbi:YopX family protein [Roseburia inulinivorans]|uniref:YopX family protein n=1 Tax=Roseburia inulinivorans TaxID=360807 RepID=UPI0032BFEEA0